MKLPNVDDYTPSSDGQSPLSNALNWLKINVDIKSGEITKNSTPTSVSASRETNTMPKWAGSYWYYLRYIDPNNNEALIDAKKEAYWKTQIYILEEQSMLSFIYYTLGFGIMFFMK